MVQAAHPLKLQALERQAESGGGAVTRQHYRLSHGLAGTWCRFHLRSARANGWWAKLILTDSSRGHAARAVFMGRCRPCAAGFRRTLLVHIPRHADTVVVEIYGDATGATGLSAARVPRLAAGAALLMASWRQLPAAGAGSPRGIAGRLRATLGQTASRNADIPPYERWIAWFDDPDAEHAELMRHPVLRSPPSMIPVILADSATSQALAATLQSVAAQFWAPVAAPRLIARPTDWRAITNLPPESWIAVIAAGEILAPTALAHFAIAAATHRHANFLCADLDELHADGSRRNPLFKPPPDRFLCRSDLPSRGICLFRPAPSMLRDLPADAASARLQLARAHADRGVRVARILTHCPPAAIQPSLPPAPSLADRTVPITAIVPSACRSRHVADCLRRMVSETEYPDFNVLVACSAIDIADRRQEATLRRLRAMNRVRVAEFTMRHFNFSRVVNRAAARATTPYLLLLNDDVVPIEPAWLAAMAGILREDGVVAVGARLLYGNDTVQHEGVVMGLGGLCEHAGRLRPRADAGPHGIGRLTREVSAVTAACLLVRRDAFLAVGGMDEAFAIALNDVDLCLRLRAAGGRIVYAGSVELYHFESLSLGRHYAGARAAYEADEVARLRQSWQAMIDADPCYNPQASLAMGREWRPEFPPRDRSDPPTMPAGT